MWQKSNICSETRLLCRFITLSKAFIFCSFDDCGLQLIKKPKLSISDNLKCTAIYIHRKVLKMKRWVVGKYAPAVGIAAGLGGLSSKFLSRTEKEMNCCSVVHISLLRWKQRLNFIWKWSSQSPKGEWRSPVAFPQLVMSSSSTSSAGAGPLCFLKSTVNTEIHQEISEHFVLTSVGKLRSDVDFIFQQLVRWPWCYCACLATKFS